MYSTILLWASLPLTLTSLSVSHCPNVAGIPLQRKRHMDQPRPAAHSRISTEEHLVQGTVRINPARRKHWRPWAKAIRSWVYTIKSLEVTDGCTCVLHSLQRRITQNDSTIHGLTSCIQHLCLRARVAGEHGMAAGANALHPIRKPWWSDLQRHPDPKISKSHCASPYGLAERTRAETVFKAFSRGGKNTNTKTLQISQIATEIQLGFTTYFHVFSCATPSPRPLPRHRGASTSATNASMFARTLGILGPLSARPICWQLTSNYPPPGSAMQCQGTSESSGMDAEDCPSCTRAKGEWCYKRWGQKVFKKVAFFKLSGRKISKKQSNGLWGRGKFGCLHCILKCVLDLPDCCRLCKFDWHGTRWYKA